MDNQRPAVRVLAAGLPLVVIALIFVAIGYAATEREQSPIPPLAAAEARVKAAQGEVASISSDRITLVSETGERTEYALASDAAFEKLEAIDLAAVQLGDWLNGGGIPHPDTILALVSLILLTEPETP